MSWGDAMNVMALFGSLLLSGGLALSHNGHRVINDMKLKRMIYLFVGVGACFTPSKEAKKQARKDRSKKRTHSSLPLLLLLLVPLSSRRRRGQRR